MVFCSLRMLIPNCFNFYYLSTHIYTLLVCQGKRIENGVYLGPVGWLTFEGRLSWKKRILAFIFERIRIKLGPFNPFEVSIKGKDESEPSNKNPFFIWFYIDEEIAVARGRQGGTAFWCRCRRVSSYWLDYMSHSYIVTNRGSFIETPMYTLYSMVLYFFIWQFMNASFGIVSCCW